MFLGVAFTEKYNGSDRSGQLYVVCACTGLLVILKIVRAVAISKKVFEADKYIYLTHSFFS